MLSHFRLFMKYFGHGFHPHMVAILIGDVLIALFETVGILLVIPLMGLVLSPQSAVKSGVTGILYRLMGEPQTGHFLIYFSLLVALFYFVKSIFHIWFSWWEHQLLARWKNTICYRFFCKILDADYQYHSSRNSSAIVSIISGSVPSAVNNFMFQTISLVSQIVVAIFLFMLIAFRHPVLTAVIASVFLLLFKLQSIVIRHQITRAAGEFEGHSLDNLFAIQQGVGAYKDTKVNLKERFFTKLFTIANKKLMAAEGKVVFYQNLPIATTELIVILITILSFNMLVAAGDSAISITQDLSILVLLVFRFIPVINRSLTAYSVIKAAVVPLHILTQEADAVNYRTPLKPDDSERLARMDFKADLALKDVVFSYSKNSHPALRGVELNIRRGEFVGVIGPSGSGKSTLIALLLGFLKPETGSYTIDGEVLDEDRIRGLRRLIGYVDQHPFIFDASVMENVAFGIKRDEIDRDRVEQALRQAELWDLVISLEKGMETSVGENGKRLSGGQRQRLAIARALYKQPAILILDEATSALDPETECRLSQAIQGLKGSLTIIAIAHRLSTLRACDRLVMMENGRIVDSGSYQELLGRNADFRHLVEISAFIPEVKVG